MLAENESAWNQTWHLPTASNPPTGKEFTELAAKALGVAPRYRIISGPLVRFLGAFKPVVGREVVGNRLSYEGMAFVRDYVFPRAHADLLSVRGPYNKVPKEDAVKPIASDPEGTKQDISEQSA